MNGKSVVRKANPNPEWEKTKNQFNLTAKLPKGSKLEAPDPSGTGRYRC